LELTGHEPFTGPDSRSFVPVLCEPTAHKEVFADGFAEYYGVRMMITQRIVWEGPWKFVFNGFDFDELYHLEDDPYELNNLVDSPVCEERLRAMTARMWQRIQESGDHSLYNSHYPPLRVAPYGPLISGQA
jgi:hypothetical protein